MDEMEEIIFKDLSGENVNRRKLKIINQTAEEMVVDVELDEGITEGTPITAKIMQDMYNNVKNLEGVKERVSAIESKLEKVSNDDETLTVNSNLNISGNIYLS